MEHKHNARSRYKCKGSSEHDNGPGAELATSSNFAALVKHFLKFLETFPV